MSKKKGMADVIAGLTKQFGSSVLVDFNEKLDYIYTGSIILNKILGIPGYPKKRISEIYGPESSGKSTLAMIAAANVLNEGGNVVYLDYEGSFVVEYAHALGFPVELINDHNRFVLVNPEDLEKGWEVVRSLLENADKIDLIIIDSLAAMTPRALLEGDPEKTPQVGLQARKVGLFLAEISKTILETNTALLIVNQIRNRIKSSPMDFGPETDSPGGRALKFYATLRVELSPGRKETREGINPVTGIKDDVPFGTFVNATCRKNKLATPFRKGAFFLEYGVGVDNLRSLVDLAENLNIIKRKGSYYIVDSDFALRQDDKFMSGDEPKFQGFENMYQYFAFHADMREKLADRVLLTPDEQIAQETLAEDAKTAYTPAEVAIDKENAKPVTPKRKSKEAPKEA
jgi:recombination protein RecA